MRRKDDGILRLAQDDIQKTHCHPERLEGAKDPVTFIGVLFRCAAGIMG